MHTPRFLTVLLACVFLVFPAALAADPPAAPPAAAVPVPIPDTPAGKALAKVLDCFGEGGKALTSDDFTESFSKAVPAEQLAALTDQIRSSLGALSLVMIQSGATDRALIAVVRGEKEETPLRIHITIEAAPGERMEGLLIQPALDAATPVLESWADFDSRIEAIIGEGEAAKSRAVSFAAYELKDGKLDPIHERSPDTRLGIGSTFKLYILGAIAQEFSVSPHNGPDPWEWPLEIKEELRSLPSGEMQNEKAGAKFPLSHFADKMISISDNTATDHLLARAGRENVERYMKQHAGHGKPELNTPFLSTRELFVLKLGADATLPERYLAADVPTRRKMLAADGEVAQGTPSMLKAGVWVKPFMIDRLEWFASARECCLVMADLHRLEQNPVCARLGRCLSINPGIPYDQAAWSRVAFKGGSEPGVLNLTYMLTRAASGDDPERIVILSFGINDTAAAVADAKIIGLLSRTFELLAKSE